jgi:hypothetical protein
MARFSVIMADTIILLNKQARSTKMVDALKYALQLFKEDRLGDVLAKSEKPAKQSTQDTTMTERRERFKAKIKEYGIFAVMDEFYGSLPEKVKTHLLSHDGTPRYSLQELVLGGHHRSAEEFKRKYFGPKKLAMLEGALQECGLYIGMSLDEVKDVFGEVPPARDHFDGVNHPEDIEEFERLIEGADLDERERVVLGSEYGLKSCHGHSWYGNYRKQLIRSALWKISKKDRPKTCG